ncbi:MAG: response regulator transcription factor [Campylobacteraceae bacterium]|nr:response regulator transcription factor [Campylobacteraceae bacterium]
MFKILILEDDYLFAQSLEDVLEDEGFDISLAYTAKEVLDLNYENNYDLYLLDINVPDMSGIDLLKLLRTSNDNTPTIFLTSYKDKNTLKECFISGADDFLQKPVDLDELILRIYSVLKRSGKQIQDIILPNGLSFNVKNKRLSKDKKDLNLPIKIISLFELCLENRDSIITKEMIVNKLWTCSEEYSEGSIRVYINNLKKLLPENSITNIKAIGYKIEF